MSEAEEAKNMLNELEHFSKILKQIDELEIQAEKIIRAKLEDVPDGCMFKEVTGVTPVKERGLGLIAFYGIHYLQSHLRAESITNLIMRKKGDKDED